ncbi:Niemann-Pick C type protein [Cavenderia fasciculata]|uniref:Niemann-Pick C type protein n=1 Tax=Cavenderia fasciculata TaxID=261658 RepID=F4PV61_CACFS|nr:Niemann-Pick C type protein [Cavenderia fasciculata]EGG21969.1 Niemann-Pick C type protein [Cavenderia fasciculata]|eukprot:XP_004359820.1 Niemann-Pick C type protein [Cavenderia fasciculata]
MKIQPLFVVVLGIITYMMIVVHGGKPLPTPSDIHVDMTLSATSSVLSYNTTTGCSMAGVVLQGAFNSNFSITTAKTFQPSPVAGGMPTGVCPSHLEYNENSCCDQEQFGILSAQMQTANTIFGRCPACMNNLWDLWCASGCSPYQSQFMIVDKTAPYMYNHVNYTKVAFATYILDPVYAEGIYNSCRDVIANGNVPFAAQYPSYQTFFNDFFGGNNPQFGINFIFDPVNGYSSNVAVQNCSESCSCTSCRDLCSFPGEYGDFRMINESIIPNTYLFDKQVPILSVWLLFGYYLFLLTLFTTISIWLIRKILQRKRRYVAIGLVLIVFIYISAIFLPVISGIVPTSSDTCNYQMPHGQDWACALVITSFSYSLAVLGLMALSSTVLYLKYRSEQQRIHYQNQLNNQIPSNGSIYSSRLGDKKGGYPSPLLTSQESRFKDIGMDDPSLVQKAFFLLGRLVSRYPLVTIAACLVFTGVCSIGIRFLVIEEDPVKLWVSPTSRSAVEKEYFDSNFGAFYRIEQLILTPVDPNVTIVGNNQTLIAELARLEIQLMNLSAVYENETLVLSDLCFQPTHRGCLVESITGIWQRNLALIGQSSSAFQTQLKGCLGNPLNTNCMDAVGTPVNPSVVLGGWSGLPADAVNASAFVTTFLLKNPPELLNQAMAWEQVWLDTVQAYNRNSSRLLNAAYSAERSVQDELSRESAADISTIVISYSVMFVYVSMALGRFYPRPQRFLSYIINSRFSLGLSGILVVASSICIAVGLCSFGGIKATLIISEVIPFLVLAIGVDNIFILVNTFENLYVTAYDSNTRSSAKPPIELTLARAMARVGPSMALASLSESLAFLLGTITKMPAVVAFSAYASVAILFDFLLQITAFAALLVLDTKRSESRRIDCIPCVSLDDGDNSDDDEPEVNEEKMPLAAHEDYMSTNSSYNPVYKKKDSLLKVAFKKYYAPFVMHPIVKIVAVVVFLGAFLLAITLSFDLQLGLDQRVALPGDSYLQAYFSEMDEYLEVGPPFYIVIKGAYNYTDFNSQNLLCTIQNCTDTSVVNVYNNAPFVHPGVSSWLDDYMSWAANPSCCGVMPDGSSCIPGESTNCTGCFTLTNEDRPNPQQFVKFLPTFFNFSVTPGGLCPVTGLAYASDLNIQNGSTIIASRFDGYHSTLRTQNDFINALKAAYYLADHFSDEFSIFVYSVFYVYFEQYLTIQSIAVMAIGLALAGVLVVCLILLANPVISLLVVLCVAMVSVDLLGVMYLWNVNLNAVSVVNVVMAIGISIEFCVHVAHAFIRAPDTMDKSEKAKYALTEVGSSIVSGIFITKLLGVVVLGFSNSEIFRVYYFRMYISIVILGALHGLVLLPVLLSFFGSDKFNFSKWCKKNNQDSLDD